MSKRLWSAGKKLAIVAAIFLVGDHLLNRYTFHPMQTPGKPLVVTWPPEHL